MELHTVVALILSGAIGVSLGLLGGGGSILAVPRTVVAVAGTFLGERFARRVPAQHLRRMFAYFVILVGIFLVAENFVALI